MAYTTVQNHCN